MGFLLSGGPHDGEAGGNDHHGGDQKYILAKNQQGKGGGGHAGDGRAVFPGAEPLLYENGDEQGGEGKLHALVVDGQQGSGQCTQQSAGDPVDMVEQGDPEAVAAAADPLRNLVPGNQGIGLICKTEDQIGLFPSGVLVGTDHGDAVKQMPGIHHKGSQRSCQQAGSGGQQGHCHILHGAGVDKQAHGPGPEHAEAALLHQNAEAEAKKNIPRHHRNGVQKGGAKKVLVQRNHSLFVKHM